MTVCAGQVGCVVVMSVESDFELKPHRAGLRNEMKLHLEKSCAALKSVVTSVLLISCAVLNLQGYAVDNAAQLPVAAVRIKDLAEMRGVRSNQLTGFGIVVGLPGTGDSKQSLVTNRAVGHMLTRMGLATKENEVTTKNIAAVMITAELPAFARIGDKIDIRISSVGDAASLEGGSLILTPLSGADNQIYAVAQGSYSLGNGMAGLSGGSSRAGSNAPKTVALAQGATVEREFDQAFVHQGQVELSLKNADFTTSSRVTKAINDHFNEFIAEAVNGGLIKVTLPRSARGGPSFSPVAFVAALEQIRVESDSRATVIINERTGTVISGANVMVLPVAISHGALQISITPKTSAMVGQINTSTTVGELVNALNQLGAGPRDLVAILQALEAAQALKAELKLM